MNRKMIYAETKSYTKKNWKIMVSYIVLSIAATYILSDLLGIPSLTHAIKIAMEGGLTGDNGLLVESYLTMDPLDHVIQIIVNTIASVFNASLIFGVLITYRNKTRLTIKKIYAEIMKKPLSILLASLMLSLINFILSMIPVIGAFVSLIFTLASYFALMVLQENDVEPIEALQLSLKLTRGHKFSIFLVEFKYFTIILAALVIWMVISLTGPVGLVIGLIGFIIITLRVSASLVAATAIYYDKIVNGI